jgi:hypothetical protein
MAPQRAVMIAKVFAVPTYGSNMHYFRGSKLGGFLGQLKPISSTQCSNFVVGKACMYALQPIGLSFGVIVCEYQQISFCVIYSTIQGGNYARFGNLDAPKSIQIVAESRDNVRSLFVPFSNNYKDFIGRPDLRRNCGEAALQVR